jgi:hypothetical protein
LSEPAVSPPLHCAWYLTQTSGFFNLTVQLPPTSKSSDRFYYKLTVQELNRSHTVESEETSLPENLQPLIQKLTMLARSPRS